MNYLVVVKRTFDESEYGSDYTFEDAYFQGCEKAFNTEEEATEYFKSFEDWEQDLLTIDELPFWVPGVMPGGRTSHSVLPPNQGGQLTYLSTSWLKLFMSQPNAIAT